MVTAAPNFCARRAHGQVAAECRREEAMMSAPMFARAMAACALTIPGCQLSLDGASCPCSDGWVCCEGAGVCAREAADCPTVRDDDPDAAADAVDASSEDAEEDAGLTPAGTVVFLNFEGATLQPGPDRADTDTSAIVTTTVEFPAFESAWLSPSKPRAEVIADIAAGVRELYSPFDVWVVTNRPDSPPYTMMMLGGRGPVIGLDATTAGVASIDCNNARGNREIAFLFTDTLGGGDDYDDRVRMVAGWAAQEVAHTFGLDHVKGCTDVMSDGIFCSEDKLWLPEFEDIAHECVATDCFCADPRIGPTQNSYQRLIMLLGPA
jgi:hypothetical protein